MRVGRGGQRTPALGGLAKILRIVDLQPMVTMTISLPDDMSGYVQEGVAAGDFQTSSDYVRALIRQDHEQLQRFRELIQEGLESPVAGPADAAYFESLRERIRHRAAGR